LGFPHLQKELLQKHEFFLASFASTTTCNVSQHINWKCHL